VVSAHGHRQWRITHFGNGRQAEFEMGQRAGGCSAYDERRKFGLVDSGIAEAITHFLSDISNRYKPEEQE
jgi:hypothetical protein